MSLPPIYVAPYEGVLPDLSVQPFGWLFFSLQLLPLHESVVFPVDFDNPVDRSSGKTLFAFMKIMHGLFPLVVSEHLKVPSIRL